MEIKDLAWFWKFGEKLLDVLQKSWWTLYHDYKEPKRRKELWWIDAENEKKMIIAKAEWEAEALGIKYDKYIELRDRSHSREEYKRIREQKNIEDIAMLSADIWKDSVVNDKEVEQEWIDEYFDKAKSVSDDDMKIAWAKILSEEIKNPWTTKKRTLWVIKWLERNEAKIFERISWFITSDNKIYKLWRNDLKDFWVNFEELLLLMEAGLINSDTNLHLESNVKGVNSYILFKSSGVNILSKEKKFEENVFVLTKTGEDIFRLFKPEVDKAYFNWLYDYFEKQWYECRKIKVW